MKMLTLLFILLPTISIGQVFDQLAGKQPTQIDGIVPGTTRITSRTYLDTFIFQRLIDIAEESLLFQRPPKTWHAIAWFPLQDDVLFNPATLDTLSNGAEEVYNFIDDDALTNTWLVPRNFTAVDSVILWTSTSSILGDSVAFDFGFSVSSAFGDTTTPLITAIARDTVDMGILNDKFIKFKFTTWSGIDIDANELVRVACIRDTNITNNMARTTPLRLHYTEIFWR